MPQTIYGCIQKLDWLCIAPHPDDAEIGAGGTLARLAGSGDRVGILELSRGEMGTQGSPSERAAECVAAAGILKLSWRGQLGLPDGAISDIPEYALRLAAAIRTLRPEVLLIPHYHDRHPDHIGAYHMAKRAIHLAGLKKASLGGEPWRVGRVLMYQGNSDIRANVLIETSDYLEAWEAAIRAHKSQFSGEYVSETVNPEVIERRKARLGYWGTLLRVRYAEAFESEEPLLLDPASLRR